MKLSKLVAKPQLIKITIDDEDIVKEYGEAVEFWIYDRQPMDVFMQLASVDSTNVAQISTVISDMVLDENGKPVLKGGGALPISVMMKVIQTVVETLGNGLSQTSQK